MFPAARCSAVSNVWKESTRQPEQEWLWPLGCQRQRFLRSSAAFISNSYIKPHLLLSADVKSCLVLTSEESSRCVCNTAAAGAHTWITRKAPCLLSACSVERWTRSRAGTKTDEERRLPDTAIPPAQERVRWRNPAIILTGIRFRGASHWPVYSSR